MQKKRRPFVKEYDEQEQPYNNVSAHAKGNPKQTSPNASRPNAPKYEGISQRSASWGKGNKIGSLRTKQGVMRIP